MNMSSVLIALAERFSGITPLIPYYHVVSNERLIHICHLHPYKDERQFMDDVDFLGKRYQPLSPRDLIDFARSGKKIKKGSFIITFDDGYSQIFSVVAPILYKKGIPAIFFLASDFIDNRNLGYRNKASIITEHLRRNPDLRTGHESALREILKTSRDQITERILAIPYGEATMLDEIARVLGIDFQEYLRREKPYLTSPQIRSLMDRGFHFGAHSLDHPLFEALPLQDQLKQTIVSLQFLKNAYGLPYSFFAFPHSDHSIHRDYFREIERIVDLSFGTSGIMKDPIATNLQRVNFERSLRPASQILARQLIKKIVGGRSGRMTINRPADRSHPSG